MGFEGLLFAEDEGAGDVCGEEAVGDAGDERGPWARGTAGDAAWHYAESVRDIKLRRGQREDVLRRGQETSGDFVEEGGNVNFWRNAHRPDRNSHRHLSGARWSSNGTKFDGSWMALQWTSWLIWTHHGGKENGR